jgi:hypothetical protein
MGSDWFRQRRMCFINDAIIIYGYINRIHLMRKFRLSKQAAARDLSAFAKSNPQLVRYDGHFKCYVNAEITAETVNHFIATHKTMPKLPAAWFSG